MSLTNINAILRRNERKRERNCALSEIVARPDLRMIGIVENRLLAGLTGEEYERLRPHLEQASFDLGEVVYESGDILTMSIFPPRLSSLCFT